MLSRQISTLGRPGGLERPEDVPGYPALESAIRSVVEHIEVSEKRTRDSLRSMQDRIAEVSERRGAPSGWVRLSVSAVLAQAGLGVVTLMAHAPLLLSIAHQLSAALLLGLAVAFAWRVRRV